MTTINSSRMSLPALVKTLKEFQASKQDFIAPLSKFRTGFTPEGEIGLHTGDPSCRDTFGSELRPVTEKALVQLGEKCKVTVPSRFVREMNANAKYRPALLDVFNAMLPDLNGSMIRCMMGNVRAFLSDKYRILDHLDAACMALQNAEQHEAFPIEASLTDSHMRLKFTTKKLFDTVNIRKNGGPSEGYLRSIVHDLFDDGDNGIVHPMVLITNSETGDGGFNISRGIFVPRCRNGIVLEQSLRAVHVGKRQNSGLLSEETIAAGAKATMLEARDILTNAFEESGFKSIMSKVHEAAGLEIPKPIAAIEQVVSDLSLSEEDSEAILRHFMDYDPTRFGLAGAVSRYAQDCEPEKAAKLEAHAGTLLTA